MKTTDLHELTGWYDYSQNPVRKGVYKISTPEGLYSYFDGYSYFYGYHWYMISDNRQVAFFNYKYAGVEKRCSNFKWCGLTRKITDQSNCIDEATKNTSKMQKLISYCKVFFGI